MFKDKFILGIVLVTIVVLIGGIFFATKMGSSTNSSSAPVPVADDQKQLLDVAVDDYIKGNKEASVTIVEYLDFECEACGAYYPLMKQLSEEFKTDVRFVNRYFPLPGHKNGMQAALSVEAASKQGKYWEMHNKLFDEQKNWGEKPAADPKIFEGYAKEIGLNVEQFKKDVLSKEVMDRVERDKSSGEKLGVNATPTFFLNGEKLQNPKSPEDFKTLIKAAVLKAPKAGEPTLGDKVHEHADFKVYLNGKQFDLSLDKYMDTKENPKDPYAHLHDGNGDVTHKHKQGVTLGYFFKSIGISFDKNCFVTDTKERYCSDGNNALKLYVNGKQNDKLGDYEFTDLDRILISYGPKSEVLDNQMKSVTDMACMYSDKCPERGKPPTENCAVGLGGDC